VPRPNAVGASSGALFWRSLSWQHAQRPPVRSARLPGPSILARDARHPKAHSPRFLGAHNFLACYLCHLVRIAASVIIAHSLSPRAPERDDLEVTRRSPVSSRPCLHPLFLLSRSLRSGRAEAPSPPETRRLSGFSDPCAPDPVTDRIEAPRVAPPIGSRA